MIGWITPYYGLTKGFKKIFDVEKIIEKTTRIKFPKSKRKKSLIRLFVKYFIGYDVLTRKLLKQVINGAGEPWFIYLHLMDTHMPYEPKSLPLVSIIRYLIFYKNWKEKMQKTWVGEKSFTEREMKKLKKMYVKATKNVDRQIRKIISLLNKEKTMVIITADHGELLGENGLVGHQFSFSDKLLNVPLLLYYFGMGKKYVTSLFETKDIFYLIKDVAEKGEINHFYEKDYIFGESKEIESVFKKLSEIDPSLSLGGRYIRTKKVKYVKYLNGKEELYKVNEKEEKLENLAVLQEMRKLLEIKEREYKRKRIMEI